MQIHACLLHINSDNHMIILPRPRQSRSTVDTGFFSAARNYALNLRCAKISVQN